MNKDLESLVEQEVGAIGYDVVLLRQGGTRSRPVLEVRIDRRDGGRVSIDDCVRVSRAVEARLDAGSIDAAAFGGRRYELQVSSPGDARRRRDTEQEFGTPRSARGNALAHGEGPTQQMGTTSEAGGARGTPTSAHTDDGSRDGRFD